MYRKFGIGDMVICKTSGVTGRVIKFYKPTACEEQTMVVTGDGRKYHAPTSEWIKIEETVQMWQQKLHKKYLTHTGNMSLNLQKTTICP